MSQITEEIWIGSYVDICDEQFLEDRQIDHIICCEDEVALRAGFPYSNTIVGYKVHLTEDTNEKTKDALIEGATKLNEWITQGHRVYLYCFPGINNSAAVAIAYFMIFKDWTYSTAHSHIKHTRWQTNISADYAAVLMELNITHHP